MDFRILGPLEVRDDEGRPVALGAGRQRALLAALLLRTNEVVSSDRLIDVLWGERPPETAHKALQGYVSQLRKALEPGRPPGDPGSILVTRAPGYVLRVEPDQVDALRFARLAAEGRRALERGDPQAAASSLAEALALSRGPPLADLAYETFAQEEAARLEELRLAALEDRIDADLACGRHAPLVGELETLVARQPLRERLRGQLMLALYRSGRQAEALEAYRSARRTLVDELGLEPGEALQRLERAILAHDPSLEPPRAPAPAAPGGDGSGQRTVAAPARERFGRRWVPAAIAAIVVAAGSAVVAALLAGGAERSRAVAPAPPPATPVQAAEEPAPPAVQPDSVAVVDPETNRVVGLVAVGARPTVLVAGHGSLWVASADDGTVSRIDVETRQVVKTIGLGTPVVDLVATHDAVWAANGSDGTVSRIDPETNAVADTIDLRGPDELAPAPAHAVAWGDGSVWVASGLEAVLRIDPQTGEVSASIDTGEDPVSLAFDGENVWASTTAERIFRLEPATNSVTGEAAIGFPVDVAAGPSHVWISDGFADRVWFVDRVTAAVEGAVPAGDGPSGIATDERSVWVANAGDGTLSAADEATGRLTATISIGHSPVDVAVAGGLVWVAVQPATT
jgi:YVTN family beta-propeller protein